MYLTKYVGYNSINKSVSTDVSTHNYKFILPSWTDSAFVCVKGEHSTKLHTHPSQPNHNSKFLPHMLC